MNKLSLGRVWIVFKREYAQRIFSRSFVGTTILVPALLVVVIAVSVLLAPRMSTPIAPSQDPAVPAMPYGSAGAFGLATVSMVLLYVMIQSVLLWGAIVMRAVLEEKQSRVLEVLLCFASPEELMTGKILGIGALSTTQVVVWLSLAVGLVVGSPTKRAMATMMHLGPSAPVYFVIFEALGYLLYSTMFCAVGAAFNSAEEVQQWIIVLILPLLGTMMLIPTVLTRPDSWLALAATMFPITAPTLMYTRLLVGGTPVWQLVLSLGVLTTSIWIAIWLCARVYRVGILMYGKRPTIREIARWMRYA